MHVNIIRACDSVVIFIDHENGPMIVRWISNTDIRTAIRKSFVLSPDNFTSAGLSPHHYVEAYFTHSHTHLDHQSLFAINVPCHSQPFVRLKIIRPFVLLGVRLLFIANQSSNSYEKAQNILQIVSDEWSIHCMSIWITRYLCTLGTRKKTHTRSLFCVVGADHWPRTSLLSFQFGCKNPFVSYLLWASNAHI